MKTLYYGHVAFLVNIVIYSEHVIAIRCDNKLELVVNVTMLKMA
jgi:hypothetical protein